MAEKSERNGVLTNKWKPCRFIGYDASGKANIIVVKGSKEVVVKGIDAKFIRKKSEVDRAANRSNGDGKASPLPPSPSQVSNDEQQGPKTGASFEKKYGRSSSDSNEEGNKNGNDDEKTPNAKLSPLKKAQNTNTSSSTPPPPSTVVPLVSNAPPPPPEIHLPSANVSPSAKETSTSPATIPARSPPPPPGLLPLMEGAVPPPPPLGIPLPPNGVPLPPGMLPPPPGQGLGGKGGGGLEASLPGRKAYKPSKTMRKLHWVPIEARAIGKTIWNMILEDAEFSQNDFESKFAEKKRSAKARRSSISGNLGKDGIKNARQEISLVGGKREENISIMLKRGNLRLRKSPQDMYKSILSMDGSLLSLENIPQLTPLHGWVQIMKLVPNEEERKAVNSFEGNPGQLSLASRLQYELARIPDINRRLSHCQTRLRFDHDCKSVLSAAEIMASAAITLRNSERIPEILRVILTLGNFLNAGTRRGNCYGFRVEVLTRLRATKSPSNKEYTLLHYVVETVSKADPDLEFFLDEMQVVVEASKLDMEHVKRESQRIRKSIRELKKRVVSETCYSDVVCVEILQGERGKLEPKGDVKSPSSRLEMLSEDELQRRLKLAEFDEDRFLACMAEFLREAEPRLEKMLKKWETATEAMGKCRAFFADDESSQIEEFLGIWAEFTEEYGRALAQVKTQQKEVFMGFWMEQKKAAREAEKQRQSKSPGTSQR
eukprot:jgi/Bigna1/80185/fgenesh1_pg.68_\